MAEKPKEVLIFTKSNTSFSSYTSQFFKFYFIKGLLNFWPIKVIHLISMNINVTLH